MRFSTTVLGAACVAIALLPNGATAKAAATTTTSSVAAQSTSTAAPASTDPTTTSEVTTTGTEEVSTSMYGTRYCEVLTMVYQQYSYKCANKTITQDLTLQEVYSTEGHSDCPTSAWNNITVPEVNSEYGSYNASLNGPRWWVMDSIDAGGNSAGGPEFTFGTGNNSLLMTRRAMMLLSPKNAKASLAQTTDPTYTPSIVQRTTTYVYNAGTMLYQLTDPDQKMYTMQTFSNQTTLAELPDLGSILTLPEGWSYSTQTPNVTTYVATQDNIAYLVRDSLQNSYQCSSANCYSS